MATKEKIQMLSTKEDFVHIFKIIYNIDKDSEKKCQENTQRSV